MSMLYVHAACQCRMSMLHDLKWKRKVDAKQKLGSETKKLQGSATTRHVGGESVFSFCFKAKN
jgi:hypothetical protein